MVDGELNGVGLGSGSKVVHTRLESLLPGIKVHRGELLGSWLRNVDIETLALANVWRTIGGKVENDSLGNLPDSLVDISKFLGDFFNLLNGSTVGNDLVPEGLVPDSERSQIAQQVLVDDGEFSSQDTSVVNVGSEGLGTLVVSQDLGGGSSGHGSDEQRVAQSVLGNVGLEGGPVPAAAGGDTPEIELELSLAGRRTGVRLVVAFLFCELATGCAGSKIDGLENVTVQLGSGGTVERNLEHGKGIGKTLDTKSDRTVLHVGVASFLNGVKVAVNDTVQVACQGHGNLAKLFKIEFERTGRVDASDQLGKTDAGKIADGSLVLGGVLDNLGTKVGRLDGSQVLLVGLAVAVILVEHVGSSGFDLGVENGKPQLLRIDGLASLALAFVFFVEFLKLLSVAFREAWTLVGAHEGPLAVGLDTFHEQIGNPEGVEQITGTVGLVTVVLSEV